MARAPARSRSAAPASLIDLYRAAQRLSSEDLARFAFEWLRPRISFERGVIITTFANHASWVDAQFWKTPDPRALMANHEKVRHLDPLTPRIFVRPNVALATCGDDPALQDPKCAPFLDHLRVYKGWHGVVIMVPSEQHRTQTVIMVLREEKAAHFTKADVATMQELAPHIVEATLICRTMSLPRLAKGTLPVALVDREGRFLETTAAFIHLFWPAAPPATTFIDEAILKTLRKGKPWPLADGAHALHGEPDESGAWHLRIASLSPLHQLSVRERQVATLFAEGTTYKAIAQKLGLSPVTVRNHLQNLYGKLGVTERSELVALVSKR